MAICPSCRRKYPDGVEVCAKDGEALLPDQAFVAEDAELPPGRMVGEYRIERRLGQGGFGTVYAAVHPVIGKTAAIKVLGRAFSSSPQMVSRFISEARAANKIRSANIIDIFGFGALDDGRHYYIMELCEGLTLEQRLRDFGPLAPPLAVTVLRGVARALDAAHEAGIVHRDLKPDNVFITFDDDGKPAVKLLDFGIAKLLGDDATVSHKTRTGAPVGTPHYMSPEQVNGLPVDRRSDIYALGVMSFEALTGELPFRGTSLLQLMTQHTSTPPPPASERRPALGTAFDAPLAHMLAKDPADRPATAGAAIGAVADAARAAGLELDLARPVPPEERRPRTRITPASADAGDAETDISNAPTALHAPHAQTPEPHRESGVANVETRASAAPTRPERKGRQIAAFAGALLLLGAAFAYLLSGSPRSETAEATARRVATAPARDQTAAAPRPPTGAPSAEATPPAPSASAAVPEPSATASISASADVSLELTGAPRGANVELDGRELGTAPGPFRGPRDGTRHHLVVRAAGFAPFARDLVFDADQRLAAPLAPLPRVARSTDYQEPNWSAPAPTASGAGQPR
ncbi:MAG: protein kinase [Polyangiaceae bacterium]|nr:protein kinase [Polyangiaceae bacterium]